MVWAAGLAPAVTEVASIEAAGTLLLQRPLPGTAVRQGTSVALEVSNGLPPEQPLIWSRWPDTTETLADTLVAFADQTGIYPRLGCRGAPRRGPGPVGPCGRIPTRPTGAIVTNGQTHHRVPRRPAASSSASCSGGRRLTAEPSDGDGLQAVRQEERFSPAGQAGLNHGGFFLEHRRQAVPGARRPSTDSRRRCLSSWPTGACSAELPHRDLRIVC